MLHRGLSAYLGGDGILWEALGARVMLRAIHVTT
jgi:hypothetical protein